MKWTIFSRLVFGYLLIAFLVLAMSGYAVFELGQLERLTYSILQTDNRIMDLEKKMTDSMLSQMRYEQKFVITKDRELYQQFLLARDDFQKYAREAMITAGASDPKDLVDTLTAKQKIYEALFEEEVRLIQSNLPYDLQRYKKEKEKTIDLIMADLQALEAASQQGAFEKIRKLGEAGANASKVAMILAVSALIGVILISLFITRSITLPVAKLIDKAREISNWVFKADLNLTSPPEIQELALAINSMCEKLKAVDKMKSDFFSIMAHELRTPLTSIKEGTSLLLEGVGGGITDTQKKLLKIIAVESHRLIDLVNASLDLSKIEAGMMAFNFTPAEVSALLQRVATEVRPWAMAKGVRIEVQNPPGLPPVPMDNARPQSTYCDAWVRKIQANYYYMEAERLLALRQAAQAHLAYLEAARVAFDSRTMRHNVGLALFRMGDLDQARREAEAAVALDPWQEGPHRLLEAIARRAGGGREAEDLPE